MQHVLQQARSTAIKRSVAGGVVALCLTASSIVSAAEVDLTTAVVVVPTAVKGPQVQAVRMLVEEVEKRTQIRWKVVHAWPQAPAPAIVVGLSSFAEPTLREHEIRDAEMPGFKGAEGYRVRVFGSKPPVVMVAGNDDRGVLFGVGRLLRELRLSREHAGLSDQLNIATAPKYPLRGHQLGYRPKTNSYDAWSVPMWEQYIRDLAVFGTNAVELLPPRTDDAADSPHFPLPQMPMMVEMSRLLDEYGLDVWIWYPAMDPDYSDPATIEANLKEWTDVVKQLPRVDAVFVPGGDPGHTDPRVLMPFLEKMTATLRQVHPKVQMWVSPQSFNQDWFEAFESYLKTKEPNWLAGVVYGPQVRVSLPQFRAMTPKKYPIRRYPDITHSIQCQYAVRDWDIAFAATEGREVINPRPLDEAVIWRGLADTSIGFISYSEGCNDDVNKIVWSGLGWDPQTPVVDVLRDYGRYFIGDAHAEGFAQGLLALERNWRGSLLSNRGVLTTLQQFQDMERDASPSLLLNWRFQQALYRAYYDAYVYERLLCETSLVEQAMTRLAAANRTNVQVKLAEAESILDRAIVDPPAPELRARVFELGDMLFQSIRMQLSVERHKGVAGRGTTLDSIDRTISDLPWLKHKVAELRTLSDDSDRVEEIQAIVRRTDPGPGGYYDDLGNVSRQPHLVRGVGFEKDPGLYETPRFGVGLGARGGRGRGRRGGASASAGRTAGASRRSGGGFAFTPMPISRITNMEMLYDGPLKMHYDNLDSNASYAVRIAYGANPISLKIRCLANEKYVVHAALSKMPAGESDGVLEFEIPVEATRGGQLTLSWYRAAGRGDNGRGNAVSEVWLVKKSAPAPTRPSRRERARVGRIGGVQSSAAN